MEASSLPRPWPLLKYGLVFTAFVAALSLRLYDLQSRPFHGDEANQAVKAGILLETGRYEYDPHEHHGPTLYYAALPVLWVWGVHDVEHARECMFRVAPALAGSCLILLLLLIPGPGAAEAGLAAWMIALSNALVYYARYGIQESLFVFFAFAAILCSYRWLLTPRWTWALASGIFLGLTHATKETSAVLFVAMAAGLAGAIVLARWRKQEVPLHFPPYGQLGVCIIAALAVSVTLFSAFFTHWRGPMDSLLTYANYLHRSGGEGSAAAHDKPWWYYFSLLAYTYRSAGPRWSEGFALLLGLAGIVAWTWYPSALQVRTWGSGERALGQDVQATFFLRWLALYTLLVALVYTLIPYKTPWNLLPFWQPMLVLGGCFGGALLVRLRSRLMRAVLAVLLAAGLVHAARQTYLGNFVYAADVRNPYVYAHTSTALMKLVKRVEDIAVASGKGDALHINILKPNADYWPLPWYLRGYRNVGYWTSPPNNADADIIIADSKLGPFVQEHTKDEYQFEYHGLRPDVPLAVFIKKPWWDKFMEGRR